MTNNRRYSKGAAVAAMALIAAGAVQSKEVMTFGYLNDPSHEAVMWALQNDKVSSDLIEIDATALDISALIQATASRTYDVVQTAAMAIPRARGRGLDLRIIGTGLRYHEAGEGAGIWVPADSEIESVADLEGKRLGIYSIGSAGITLVRIALAEVHGMTTETGGGDIELVEMPAPSLPSALATDRIDAATLIHAQAFQAMQTGDFVPIAQIAQDLHAEYGTRMVSAVLAGYGDRLEANPELYTEFLDLVHASMEYAIENPDEVFTAVGEETDTDPAFFEAWFTRFSEFPVRLTEDDLTAIEILWDRSIDMGLLDDVPPVSDTIWAPALQD